MPDVCRFKFKRGMDKKTIEEQITLAIITAECTFGQAKVRLNAGYIISSNKVVIDVSSDVGEYIAQVFTGLMTRKFGEDKFTVEKIKKEHKDTYPSNRRNLYYGDVQTEVPGTSG